MILTPQIPRINVMKEISLNSLHQLIFCCETWKPFKKTARVKKLTYTIMYFRIAFNQICWEYKNIEDSLPAVSHNSRRSLPPHDLTNICIKNKLFDKKRATYFDSSRRTGMLDNEKTLRYHACFITVVELSSVTLKHRVH